MSYNLYQVQMANAWAERCNKESAIAERFWLSRAMNMSDRQQDTASRASYSPSNFSVGSTYSKASVLRDRLEKLEAELKAERAARIKVEHDLLSLKSKNAKASGHSGRK